MIKLSKKVETEIKEAKNTNQMPVRPALRVEKQDVFIDINIEKYIIKILYLIFLVCVVIGSMGVVTSLMGNMLK